MVHSLIVVKESRDEPIPDRPISFPPFANLHLELMENKKKLKRNLPPIKIQPLKVQPPPLPPPKKKEEEEDSEIEIEQEEDPKDKKKKGDESKEKPAKKPKSKKKEEIPEDSEDEEDEMVKELGGGKEDKEPEHHEEREEPENTGVVVEEDPYAGLSPEERERQEKEEYIWRFKILKRQYPKRSIPEYNEHDDFYTMKTSYERTIKEIHLEVNVDSYRMYLIGGFWAVEFVACNILNMDLKGFAAQQQAMMDKYERFLIELGERSYSSWGSNLPVEIRLLGFVVIQAGIFYVGKMMMTSGGANLATIFNAMTGQNSPASSGGSRGSVEGQPKMKGPSIKVEDIRRPSEERRPEDRGAQGDDDKPSPRPGAERRPEPKGD